MSKIDSTRWSELSPLLDEVLELSGGARGMVRGIARDTA